VGEFELLTERITDGEVVSSSLSQKGLVQLGQNDEQRWTPREGHVPPDLPLCRGCNSYVWSHESICPHCGVDLRVAEVAWEEDVRRRTAAMDAVKALLQQHQLEMQQVPPTTYSSDMDVYKEIVQ
jgi:hypothetical protein